MDFLPTKGIEYLLVIGYLLVLIPFWWVLQGSARRQPAPTRARTAPAMPGFRSWFRVPEGVRYHPGHTWAVAEADGVFRVGVDDFAQRLIGPPEALRLPEVGASLDQGERGWSLSADGREVDLLSPVRGRVVEVNRDALRDPSLLTEDPYGRGWLLKVEAPRPEATRKNLMPWQVAEAWMENAAQRLSHVMSPELGQVLQDGGVLVSGLARQIDPEHWDRLAAELLLTDRE